VLFEITFRCGSERVAEDAQQGTEFQKLWGFQGSFVFTFSEA